MIVALVDCRSVEIHSRVCTHAHLLHCRCYKCSHGLGEVDLWSTEKFIWKKKMWWSGELEYVCPLTFINTDLNTHYKHCLLHLQHCH